MILEDSKAAAFQKGTMFTVSGRRIFKFHIFLTLAAARNEKGLFLPSIDVEAAKQKKLANLRFRLCHRIYRLDLQITLTNRYFMASSSCVCLVCLCTSSLFQNIVPYSTQGESQTSAIFCRSEHSRETSLGRKPFFCQTFLFDLVSKKTFRLGSFEYSQKGKTLKQSHVIRIY